MFIKMFPSGIVFVAAAVSLFLNKRFLLVLNVFCLLFCVIFGFLPTKCLCFSYFQNTFNAHNLKKLSNTNNTIVPVDCVPHLLNVSPVISGADVVERRVVNI